MCLCVWMWLVLVTIMRDLERSETDRRQQTGARGETVAEGPGHCEAWASVGQSEAGI